MKRIFTSKSNFPKCLIPVIIMLFSLSVLSQEKHIIQVANTQFTPNELTITVGDTVEWQNTQGYHNVNGTQDTYPSNPESFGNSPGNGWVFSHVFKTAGNYDYRCDPHFSLGMIGKITAKENMEVDLELTINFMSMTPHVGQILWIAVIDKDSGLELDRKSVIVTVDFSIVFSGIKKNHSYWINFYADHNGNGTYDIPPADHAWSIELNNVTENSVLNFTHNTNFTNIMWKNKLTIHFMSMNPHVGQNFHLSVYEKETGNKIQEVDTVAETDFMLSAYGIESGKSYNVDFYADHNGNGIYDSPPADHAWRIELSDVVADTTLTFTHNTNFTDISIKTGISDELTSDFNVYPNPASEKIFIKTGKFNSSSVQVRIFDISGKLKISQAYSFSQQLEIDIRQIVNGLYFMEISNQTQKEMLKFVKN